MWNYEFRRASLSIYLYEWRDGRRGGHGGGRGFGVLGTAIALAAAAVAAAAAMRHESFVFESTVCDILPSKGNTIKYKERNEADETTNCIMMRRVLARPSSTRKTLLVVVSYPSISAPKSNTYSQKSHHLWTGGRGRASQPFFAPCGSSTLARSILSLPIKSRSRTNAT